MNWLSAGGKLELELLDQELECRLGLGVAGQQQLSSVGSRQMDIDHLDGGEFLQCAARGKSGCQGSAATARGGPNGRAWPTLPC
jgi:hypothetical protein